MGTAIRDEPDKPATAKANTHTYRTNHRKTEQEGPSSHPVTVALETVPKPDRKTGKERKNNQKDNKNAQKRGTENLIRGKSVAPNLNIYAKHAPNPAYIPYIIHSVSAKRKINRKRTVLRSAHKMETTGQERKTVRLKTEKNHNQVGFSQKEHILILDAMLAGDREKTEQLAREHVIHSRNLTYESLGFTHTDGL